MVKQLLLIPLLTLSVFGEKTERLLTNPVPEYAVKRASEKVTVDGRLDEGSWKKATPITLEFPWTEQSGEKQATIVRMLWDDEFLYVAYECGDQDITAKHTQHDDPTYEDDCVELFLNPNPEQNSYVGLEMSARSVLYDYLNKFPYTLEKSYDLKGVKLAVHLDGTLNNPSDRDKGWTLELAIPLSNFTELMNTKRLNAGMVWSANFNRWDGTEPHRRLSMWSDSGRLQPNPHNPARFGRLHFAL